MSDTDTFAGLHASLDRVGSSIWIPKSVYVYLRVKLGTVNNTIIFVILKADILLLPVAS